MKETSPIRRALRFPIFWKFLISSLILVGLLLAGSYVIAKRREKDVSAKGQYLEKHIKRYVEYQQGLGAAVHAVATVLADQDGLRAALEDPARLQATPIATRMYDGLMAKYAIRPDVFIVVDADGRPVFLSEKSPIEAGDLTELEAVSRLRRGETYHDEIIVQGGKVLQAAGTPVRGLVGKGVVGGILVGVYVERYYADFMKQSDDRPKMQYRLSLVRDGQVLASMFPAEKWKELGEQVHPERRGKAADGRATVPIIKFDGAGWDFADEEAAGFVGAGHGAVGTLYLMRYRDPDKAQSGLWAPLIVGIFASIIVAAIMALWITRSLKLLIRATKEIAEGEGDLTKRIEISANDEITDLADNLNRVFDNLHRLAHDVQSASMQVGTSSAEISAASKQMLEGAKDQAVKIESSTAAVTELSSSIQQVASNALQATNVAQKSNEAVGSAMASMERIRTTVDEAAEKIQELGESGKRIGNIVEVIRQISEQTSLLALNASIEAAHAGEQGRGFAVVADEVSSLARRVGQSAKDIEDLIATIKEQTADAVRAMQNGTKEVESGTGMVTGTLENLKAIIEMVQDTAGAVQEQAIVSDEIARNMDAVQKIANEVLASSEEAVIQGEQLHALAHHLEESVRGFNLDGAEVAPSPPVARPPLPPAPAPPHRSLSAPPAGRAQTGRPGTARPRTGRPIAARTVVKPGEDA
jgi:methyl-accepting chemotaxis protein